MPWYRRAHQPGGTFFFTLVTEGRSPFLCDDGARPLLHAAFDACRSARPFDPEAMVLLPDHLHSMWTLPPGDADFSGRWASIKATFTHAWLAAGGAEQPRSASRVSHRRRGVWQRKFWEHCVHDWGDFGRHLDYIHYNPVKHGYVTCPHLWPYSTFDKWVKRGVYAPDWMCGCGGRAVNPPEFNGSEEWELD